MDSIAKLQARLTEIGKQTDEKAKALAKEDISAEQAGVITSEIEALNAEFQAGKTKLETLRKAQANSEWLEQPQNSIARETPKTEVARAETTRIEFPQTYRTMECFKGDKGQETAYRFGTSLAAMMGMGWAKKRVSSLGLDYMATVNEGVNSAGGVFVLPEFSSAIIRLVEDYGVARRNCEIVPMSSDTKTQPRRVGGVTIYAMGEEDSFTESTPSWDNVTLVAKKWGAMVKRTNDVAEDAVIDFADAIGTEIALAYATQEDTCCFNGDGTSTYHGMYGIRAKMLATHGVVATSGQALGAGNTLAEITLANYNTVVGLVPRFAGILEKWYTSKWVYANSMQRLAYAAGGVTANEILNGVSTPTFLGYPVEIVPGSIFPTSDNNSQILALFGDLSMAVMFGDRRQLTIQAKEVDDDGLYDRISFLGRERFDIVAHEVGTTTAAGPIVSLISAAS
jgi:HK97 family phage major capsid protein